MDKKFIVSAYGKDRPGIVADVTRILYEYGCNLEDTRMANLSGDFSLMILFSAPDNNDIETKLFEAYTRLESEKGISAHIRPASPPKDAPVESHTTYILKVEGLDHTGIVYRISRDLADRKINIANLDSSLAFTPESGTRVYKMEVLIEVKESIDMDLLRTGLRQLEEDLHVEIIME